MNSIDICNEIKLLFSEQYIELKNVSIVEISENYKHNYLGFYDSKKNLICLLLSHNNIKLQPSQFIFTLLHEFSHCIDIHNNPNISKDYNFHGKEFYDIFRNVIKFADQLDIFHVTMNNSLERIDDITYLDHTKSIKIGYSNKYPDFKKTVSLIRINIKNGKNVKTFTIDSNDVDSIEKIKCFIKNKLGINKNFNVVISDNTIQNNSVISVIKL